MSTILRMLILPGVILLATRTAADAQSRSTPQQPRRSPTDRSIEGRRSVTLPGIERQRALRGLPDIRTFADHKSDRFLVDLDVVRTGHPYKGRRAQKPHTGGHIYFKFLEQQPPAGQPRAFPAIYAVADGVISRIDYAFKLREMYEPALKRRVANRRYGIGLLFATMAGAPVDMHYSIEPFIDPEDDRFYEPFIRVRIGQRVKRGDVIAHMYLPDNRQLASKSHIHFNLLGGRNRSFMAAAIFGQNITRRFHRTWDRFGFDGDQRIPACMGYLLTPQENPFGTGAQQAL
ncbi:MAG: hypothetical protein ABGZ17_05675 [Planctomycetaceae bacterium]